MRRQAQALRRASATPSRPPTAPTGVPPERSLDIERIGELTPHGRPILTLYRTLGADGQGRSAASCSVAAPVSLSDVLPTFEHLGAKVVDERPYEVTPRGGDPVWIYDFGLSAPADALQAVADAFTDAFLAVWSGELEDDGLNGLVLAAGLTGREVTIIRAVSRYLRQAAIAFSDAYMERTLVGNPDIARAAGARCSRARFDPDRDDPARGRSLPSRSSRPSTPSQSLDQDRILRSFLSVRAGDAAHQLLPPATPAVSRPATCPSSSIRAALALLPQPRPRFEIFVYSPRVEGVHLRGGRVARGGLRWSDRREDFRTEVLGLMKAQMVKNAADRAGRLQGRVRGQAPPGRRPTARRSWPRGSPATATFLRGLLDLTDNYVGGQVGPARPRGPLRRATIPTWSWRPTRARPASRTSPTRWPPNTVSGSGMPSPPAARHGYDHKEMGITARGAWESVKRHFRELGHRRPERGLHGRRDRRHVRRRVRQRDAAARRTSAWWPPSTTARLPRPRPRPADQLSPSAAACSSCRARWTDYDPALISRGRRRVRPQRQSRSRSPPQVREAPWGSRPSG